MANRTFRFAAQISSASYGDGWAATAKRVEELGYSSLLMPDHFGDQLAPVPALMAAAAATTGLRVGSLVFDNDYRHPLVLAKECATVDVLSGGRLEVGLGAGWMRSDYDESGIAYDPPKVRIDRFLEGLAIVKGLLSGESFSFSGDYYNVQGHQGTPKPVQQPRPPIIIGAGGKRMLSIAAREADIVSVNFDLRAGEVNADTVATGTLDKVQEKLSTLREAAGDRYDDIELSVTVFFGMVTDDRDGIANAMAPTFGLTGEQALEIPFFCAGTVDQICDDLRRRRDELGFSYVAFGGDSWQAMAPVVERLAGT